ncbi:GNAT family N-acetyltransferase [Rubrimonas sp.]|uniref:GNAT family N-acetyltransferase n=1 Tax=Rubrimonas sp. TaxID=2036015 RepID=UPI002FDE30D9
MGWAPPDHATIMAALDASWPGAEAVRLGGWTLRRGLDGGRRASSVWPASPPDRDLAEAIAEVERVTAEWGQPALFQLGPPDMGLDATLAERGYAKATPCLLMTADAASVAANGTGGRMVIRVRAPLALLDAFWSAGGIVPARRAVMARVACARETLILRSDDDRVAAACFVAAPGAVAVMSALLVAPSHRRNRLGAHAVAAAAEWAAEAGAQTLALSVEAENAAAVALYRRLGFVEASRYWYRQAAV